MNPPKAFTLEVDNELVGILARCERSFRFDATKEWARSYDGRLFGSVVEAESVLRQLRRVRRHAPVPRAEKSRSPHSRQG